jgi:hypothetical protein
MSWYVFTIIPSNTEAQRVKSWLAVLQQASVEDAAIVYFTKSQFDDKIGYHNSLTLLLS